MNKLATEASPTEAEALSRAIWFANSLVMKNVPLPLLRQPSSQYSSLIESVEHLLLERHRAKQLFLPELSAFNNRSIGLFSDYSGEGPGRYFVFSVLICGFNMRASFEAHMGEIRKRFGLGTKEIAYKDLKMGPVHRALPEYLAAADKLPGFLCTVAVDKRIKSVFGTMPDIQRRLVDALNSVGVSVRKPAIAEKLARVVHLAAYLTALLGHNGQKVFWMTDNDEICPTQERHMELLNLFARVLPEYQRFGCQFDLMGGATPFEERSVEMNDLLSLPDLAAGIFGDYLTKRDDRKHEEIYVKQGADKIMLWLGSDGIGLKKLCCVLRKGGGDFLERCTIKFDPVSPTPRTVIPIFDWA